MPSCHRRSPRDRPLGVVVEGHEPIDAVILAPGQVVVVGRGLDARHPVCRRWTLIENEILLPFPYLNTLQESILLFPLLLYLAVLGGIGLVGYAYLADLTPDQRRVVEPVTLNPE